jgi:hypothetical protein
MFDKGIFTINDELTLFGVDFPKLNVHPGPEPSRVTKSLAMSIQWPWESKSMQKAQNGMPKELEPLELRVTTKKATCNHELN